MFKGGKSQWYTILATRIEEKQQTNQYVLGETNWHEWPSQEGRPRRDALSFEGAKDIGYEGEHYGTYFSCKSFKGNKLLNQRFFGRN